MTDPVARMDAMRDMLLYANQLYSFCLDIDDNLTFSNCPNRDFFYGLYSTSCCRQMIQQHFSSCNLPVISYDRIGLAWIAAAQFHGSDLECMHLLGPFFTMETSEAYLHQVCSQLKISKDYTSALTEKLKLIPVISFNHALRYAIMLYYAVTGNSIEDSEILITNENSMSNNESVWTTTTWHGTWEAEQQFLSDIKEGRNPFPIQLGGGNIGRMTSGDPLRQAKNEIIIFIALCIRAAIESGVSPEGAYNLSDYYIQRCESCISISDVHNCAAEMTHVLIQRVRSCKQNRKFSLPVSACLEYIATHVKEHITLEEIAKNLGYSAYYLSNRVKSETGESIGNTIKKQKIETAKHMLVNSILDVAEVSEALAFSSPSFFSATFRKYTGMTPSEYQRSNGNSDL